MTMSDLAVSSRWMIVDHKEPSSVPFDCGAIEEVVHSSRSLNTGTITPVR